MQRAIWQRNFWEHAIRGERDYARHVDYPVKHGYVTRAVTWLQRRFPAMWNVAFIRRIGPVRLNPSWRQVNVSELHRFDAAARFTRRQERHYIKAMPGTRRSGTESDR